MRSRRSRGSIVSLCVALALLAGCGSRTALDANPIPGPDAALQPPVPLVDAGPLACFNGTRVVGEIPIDLYFALDRSKSMATVDPGATKSRWNAIAAAMEAFVQSPLSDGLGAGLMFFPRASAGGDALCAAADYSFPVVPIGMLPAAGSSILRAISLQTLESNTPTTSALEGAHVYARAEQVKHGDHVAGVVVVTDGAPHGCDATIPGTSAIAAAAAAGSPAILTYVLGVGPNLSNLNAIAQAGGTGQAYLVETSGESALLAALEAIRTSAQKCEFVLPIIDGKPRLDPTQVITRTSDGGSSSIVAQVADAEACTGGPGWYYDPPLTSISVPAKIVLCPSSCSPLVHGTNNHLDVAIGCGG
jgi:hypothetical protein